MRKHKAIFFDRDGVVNYRLAKDYVKTTEEFHLLPDFLQFFQEIKQKGYLAILISNQQGVGKGFMTEKDLCVVLNYMQKLLYKLTGFKFDDIFYCIDLADQGSFRRKPNPGMLLEAIDKWGIIPDESWMVGDSPTDAEAGRKAGVNTILLGNYKINDNFDADIILDNLFQAIKYFNK
jgi:D-glycero-D-manno-heptose 1,7-bisphosphate phosphatase